MIFADKEIVMPRQTCAHLGIVWVWQLGEIAVHSSAGRKEVFLNCFLLYVLSLQEIPSRLASTDVCVWLQKLCRLHSQQGISVRLLAFVAMGPHAHCLGNKDAKPSHCHAAMAMALSFYAGLSGQLQTSKAQIWIKLKVCSRSSNNNNNNNTVCMLPSPKSLRAVNIIGYTEVTGVYRSNQFW